MFHMPKMLSDSTAVVRVQHPHGYYDQYNLHEVNLKTDAYGTKLEGRIAGSSYHPYEVVNTNSSSLKPAAAKEVASVTKQYDVDSSKNIALAAIKHGIDKLELALFTRNRRIEEVKREQNAEVAKASINLDSLIAQALQVDVIADDLILHFPEQEGHLLQRLDEVVELVGLDNADVLV